MLDKFFFLSIISLIFISCLFYGGVKFSVIFFCEILTSVIMLLWFFEKIFKKKNYFFDKILWIPICFFISLIIFQLVPIPLSLIKIISLKTYNIYRDYSLNWTNNTSFSLSISPYLTLEEFFKIITYFSLIFIVINRIQDKKALDLILKSIIFLGFFISILGIIQRLERKDSLDLVMGTFQNRNNFSGYINMIIPLGIGYFLKSKDFWQRLIYAIFTGVMTIALFMSLSRGGFLVHLISLLFFFVLLIRRIHLRKISLIVIFWPLLIIIVFLNYFNPMKILSRFFSDPFLFLGHGYLWKDILRIWRDFPIFGTGLGTFQSISSVYNSQATQLYFVYAHNDVLQLLSEVGILGIFFIFLFFAIYFYQTMTFWKKRHDPFAVVMGASILTSIFSVLVYSFFDFNLHILANSLLFSILLGVGYRVIVPLSNHECQ